MTHDEFVVGLQETQATLLAEARKRLEAVPELPRATREEILSALKEFFTLIIGLCAWTEDVRAVVLARSLELEARIEALESRAGTVHSKYLRH